MDWHLLVRNPLARLSLEKSDSFVFVNDNLVAHSSPSMENNIIRLLFDCQFKPITLNDVSSFDLMKFDAITYVDYDGNVQTLTYAQLWHNCFNIHQTFLQHFPNSLYHSILIENIHGNSDEKLCCRIRYPLIIYGDCHQWTPVFMLAANLLNIPFYYIKDRQTLLAAIDQFRKIDLIHKSFFVTHKNRLKELQQVLAIEKHSQVFESFDAFINDYHFVCDKTTMQNYDHERIDSFLNVNYLINTSGTSSSMKNDETISLKTVIVTHESIMSNVQDFRNEFKLNSSSPLLDIDTVLLCSPFSFDPSICDLYLAISSYCHVILLDNALKHIARQFINLLFKFKVTYMTITPSLWNRISNELLKQIDNLQSPIRLRYVNFGGESCPEFNELLMFRSKIPGLQFRNLYGLTEMSAWACLFDLDKYLNKRDNQFQIEAIPIMGRPITDTSVYLDEQGQIIIESDKRMCVIFDGEQWSLTSKISTNDIGEKMNSLLYFVGRNYGPDYFIKLNGIKCFPTKIEQAILREFGLTNSTIHTFTVKHCFVEPSKWRNNHPILEIFLIVTFIDQTKKNSQKVKDIIRVKIVDLLKEHNRIPFRLHFVDSESHIILNDNGKLDIHKIRQHIDQTEMPIIEQWTKKQIKETLEAVIRNHVDNYQTDRTLFELGVDSMKALAIALELDERFLFDDENSVNIYESLIFDNFKKISTKIKKRIRSMERSLSKTTPRKKFKSRGFYGLNFKRTNLSARPIIKNDSTSKSSFRIIHKWSYFMEQCVDSSPLIVTFSLKFILICTSHSGLICAFDLTNNQDNNIPECIWSEHISSRIEASPVSSGDGDLIFVGDYDGFIRAFNTTSGQPVWNYQTMNQIKSTPIVFQNKLVLCGSFDHHLYCWRQSDGELKWRVNINDSSIFSSPVIWIDSDLANDNNHFVISCTLNGTIACCWLTDGRIRWKQSYSNKPIFSTPTICSNNLLLVGMIDSRMLAISLQNGSIFWQCQLENCPIFSSPCLIQEGSFYKDQNDSMKIVSGTNGKLVFCSKFDCPTPLWTFQTDSNVYSDVVCLYEHNWNVLLVIETNGQIHLLNIDNGQACQISQFTCFPGQIFSTPVVHLSGEENDKVFIFVGCRDSNIHCLQIEKCE